MVYGKIHYRADDGSFASADFDDFRWLEGMGGDSWLQARLSRSTDVVAYGDNLVGICKGSPDGREKHVSSSVPAGYRVTWTPDQFVWTTPHYLRYSEWSYQQSCPLC